MRAETELGQALRHIHHRAPTARRLFVYPAISNGAPRMLHGPVRCNPILGQFEMTHRIHMPSM